MLAFRFKFSIIQQVGFSPIACKLFLLYTAGMEQDHKTKPELRLMKKEEEGGDNLDGA